MNTFHRLRSIKFLLFLLLPTLVGPGEAWSQGQPITFSVTGDVPYGSGEIPEFQALMDEHDLFSPSDFIVHVGDIKSGGGSCAEDHFTNIAEMLTSISVPAFIIPGDNEWTDCSDENQAWSYWMTHLFELENHFCGTPNVERHVGRQELFAFVMKGVLFVGINLVGGGNDSNILQADAEWITQQFQANKNQVRAAVVFAQAQGSGGFESDFQTAANNFAKPVLYIHGNDHGWKLDDPYLQANITRVVIDRGNKPPVHVTVAMSGENPFSFERDPWPSGTLLYNRQPCVSAGSDQIIAQTESVILQGYATDDGVPLSPGTLSYNWTKVSGPGSVLFGSPFDATSAANFSTGGNYQLALIATDGDLVGADTVLVQVQSVGPSVFISDVALDESDAGTVALFSVQMTNPDGQDVTVNYATSNGSAMAGSDYEATAGNLVLTDAAPSANLAVTIIGDTDYETDETFAVNLSNPTHGTIADGQAIGTIINDDLPAAPVISSFTPAGGPAGTEITIAGANFVEISEVSFHSGVPAVFEIDSQNQIRTTVPAAANDGPLTITNTGGSGTSTNDFSVILIPNITSITPAVAPAGAQITISGFHFTGASDVMFNGAGSFFQVISDNEIRAEVPDLATTGKVSVITPDGTGESQGDFSVVVSPTVASFSPNSGPVGTEVTVFGTDFKELTDVSFGGFPASVFELDSDTQLRAEVPGGANTGGITVTNVAGTGMSLDDFTVTVAPSSLSFTPTDDAYVRSDRAGNNYGDKSHLDVEEDSAQRRAYLKFAVTGLGGAVQSAKIILLVTNAGKDGGAIYPIPNEFTTGGAWTEGELTWDNAPPISGTPLSSTGGVNVGDIIEFDVTAAINGNGTYSFGIKNASTSQMEYSSKEGSQAAVLELEALSVPIPVISSFSPAAGAAGDEVTIVGLNFSGTSSVRMNGTEASFSFFSDAELRAIVPSGASSGKIRVTNGHGSAESSSDFSVVSAPIISSFNPTEGPEGSTVTISGTHFTQATALSFNGTAASGFNVISDGQITATVPAGATTGPISVSNPAGQTVSGTSFKVTRIPVISSFTPGGGPAGTVVTLSGNNFGGTTGAAFGDVAANFTYIDNSQITVVVPDAATSGLIKVTNSDGVGESTQNFALILPPTISSFVPASGPPGTEVTLSGSGFDSATDVSLSGTPAGIFTVDSDNQLRTTVPSGASTGKISVVNSAGVGESTTDFQITAPPSMTSFTPSQDAWVRSDRPGNNYGGSGNLDVEEDTAQRHAYLKFVVTGLGGAVQSAKIIVLVTNSGKDGGAIYPIANEFTTGGAWTEAGLTWDNAPAISGTPLSSTGAVSSGDIVEFDVTAAITGNGTYSFGIKNASTSHMEYSSKEGSQAPILQIDVFTSPVPVVSSFTPSSGVAGTEVTITGLNCASTQTVAFNGMSASFQVDSNTQVRATVPAGANSGKIAITNPDGTGQSSATFSVILPPTLSGFSPTSGPVGTPVTLQGQNLSAVMAVSFGQTAAGSFAAPSGTQLLVHVPAGAIDSQISVASTAGTAQTTSAFDVTLPPAPSLSGFSPASGPVGTEVTISGQNFAGITGVTIAGQTAAYEVDSSSQIRATVASGATTGKVVVTNGSGSAESSGNFEVTQPPSTITLTPIDDSFGKSSSPSKTYGSSDELRVKFDSDRVYHTFLKFEVTGVGSTVQSAKLRMLVVSSTDDGGSIYLASNYFAGTTDIWEEGVLNWENQPEILGSPLSSLGKIKSDNFVEFDVTAAITGDGIYTFAIKNNSSDSGKWSSKEGPEAPQLIIQTGPAIPTSSSPQ